LYGFYVDIHRSSLCQFKKRLIWGVFVHGERYEKHLETRRINDDCLIDGFRLKRRAQVFGSSLILKMVAIIKIQ
jgi:hypothetical protein